MTNIEFYLERIRLLEVERDNLTRARQEGDWAEMLWHRDEVTLFERSLVLAGVLTNVAKAFTQARHSIERKAHYVPF